MLSRERRDVFVDWKNLKSCFCSTSISYMGLGNFSFAPVHGC
jgi:hypothetical protein